jgi:hypothetical protein
VLVDPDDGAVDDRVLEVRIAGQTAENHLEDAIQCPSSETLEDRIPIPESRGQVAPRRAGAGDPQHRFEKAPIILAGAAGVANLAGKQRRNPLPLLVAQYASIQGEPLLSGLAAETAFQRKPRGSYECQQALI